MKFARALCLLGSIALLCPTVTQAASTLRVISWNLRREGQSGDTNPSGVATQAWTNFGTASNSPNGFDVIFCQEVMNATVATDIKNALNTASGVTWAVAQVGPLGRTSYKEYYACIYRTDRVALISNGTWTDSADIFDREPQIVRLRDTSTSADYTFLNFHTYYGNGGSDIQNEIKLLPQPFNGAQAITTADQDVILLGDTNLNGTHAAWNNLYSTANVSPAVTNKYNGLTSLNTSGGYVNPYDHFLMQAANVTEFSTCDRDYIANTTTFVADLSDHAPIWLKLYSTADTD